MMLLDVNIVLAAHRVDHPDHTTSRGWLDRLLASGEQFGVPWTVWWSFLWLASHPRIFEVPTPAAESFDFIRSVRAQPGHISVEPGPRHAEIFQRVVHGGDARGDLVPDAVLAALALEHGAEMISFDRDFARFPDLRWTIPELSTDDT